MKNWPALFLSTCLVFFSFLASSQNNFRFKNISINQGLSQSTVSAIVEDEKGILWFATYDGLNKYDGKSFKVFRANGPNQIKLKSSKINNLFLAQNDQLLIYTDGGLDILDLKTEHLLKDSFLNYKKIDAPCLYSDSTIIFSNRKGSLETYNPFTHEIKLLHSNIKLPPNEVLSSTLIYDNKLLLIQKNKVQVLGNNFELLNEFIVDDILQSARQIEDKLLIAGRKKGIIEINLKTKEVTEYKKLIAVLNVVKTEIVDNQIFAMTYGHGMLKIDTNKKEIDHNEKENKDNQYITSSHQDRKSNIWIGTDGSGLNFFNKGQLIFNNISPQRLGSVRAVAQGLEKLYIATFSNGCFSYDIKTKTVEKIYHNEKKFCNALAYNNGKLWIGYDHNGVDIFDLNLKKVVHHIPYFEETLLGQFKSRIYRIDNLDNDNMVVNMRSEGLALVSKKNYKIEKKIHQNNSELTSSDIRFTTLSKDQKRLYIGSIYQGLIILSYPELEFIKNINYTSNKEVKISVKHIREDNLGNIWLGTNGTGLLVFDKKFNEIAHWSTENSLKNDVIYATLNESNNAIWLSSNEGIARMQYSFENNKLTIEDVQDFNINNGLQSNEFNSGAYCKTNNGLIAFGGLDNLNVFDPKELKFDRINGQVIITDFLVRNKAIKTKQSIHYLDNISLLPEQNDIGISFIVPGYNEGIEIEYRYRLKGYQEKWQLIGSRNNVDFTNLSPDIYKFQVQARYSNNAWGKEFTEFTFEIETPFYKTWWFYLLIILGAMLIIGSIIQLRINYIKNTNKNKLRLMIESQEKERSRISRELHDDFGGRLSTLKLYMEAIKVRPEQAQEIAKNTSSIIDQSIVELRNILLNLSPKTLTDDGLEIALQEIANSINKTKLLHVSSSYSMSDELKSSAAISIYRIIYELVNNTIKHADASQIDITLLQRKDGVVLVYEDNGIGIKLPKKSKGYGLSNIQNHLQVHDAVSYIDSEEGQGYHFTAEFPLDVLD
jgi:signal transduction histidine kinase/ligand-binding sensor domain-containing protein